MTLSMDDFREGPDKHVNWAAYRAAQVNAGEACARCKSLIFPAKGHSVMCYDCQRFIENDEVVESTSFIRCPKCTYVQGTEDLEFRGEGPVGVTCYQCEFDYEIDVYFTLHYKSPAKGEKEVTD